MGVDKGSLEPSCSPAKASNEPQEEAGGQASPESYSIMILVDLDECSASSGNKSLWKETLLEKKLWNLVCGSNPYSLIGI